MGPFGCGGALMAVGKKGIAFILIAIVFVIIISIIVFTKTEFGMASSQEAIESRITTMDTFLDDFYTDVNRASLISGYRAFIAMEEFLTDPGNAGIAGVTTIEGFYIDPSITFIEVFMNGTIGGETSSLMNNASFRDYQYRVNLLTDIMGLDFNATVTDAIMNQSDPWSVNVHLRFNINLVDQRGLASWKLNKTVTTNIPLTDLKDPIYTVNTGLPVTVRPFPYDEFIDDTGDANDTSNFQVYFDDTYFISSNRSPSFVMRFSNDLRPSPYGIESLINMEDLFAKDSDLVKGNLSIVDFMYFSDDKYNATSCSFEGTPGIPSWVKLDNESVIYPYSELATELEHSSC